MGKTRDHYLQNLWKRYPEMPRGALKWGRVDNCRLGVHILSTWTFKDSPEIKAEEVLLDGDLIAVMPANQLVLLAPNLTNRLPKNELWNSQKKWQDFMSHVRKIFIEKKFTDIKTPLLVSCPGTEPSIEVFETQFILGSKVKKMYLPTSPELNLKKLLSEGAEKIFEITSVFRNSEQTERHAPEFVMIEWYRAFSHLNNIKMDVIELIESSADFLKVDRPVEVLSFTVAELFKQYCQFDLTPQTGVDEFKQLALKLGVDVSAAQCIDDYFYLIFTEKIENKWPLDRLVFVEKYPPYQAALARLTPEGWAERFEVYWKGYELGNAFHELNDSEEQKKRALADLQQKKLLGRNEISLDNSFFDALDYGLPPSAGIAIGMDRLYMALNGLKEIKQLRRVFYQE